MTEFNNKAIPEGWAESKLSQLLIDPKGDLVDGPFGSNLKRTDYCDSGVPVFKIQNIKTNTFVDGVLSYVSSEKAVELKRHSFKKGDLIITKLGNPLGLCCEVPQKYPEGIIVADLMRLRLKHEYVVKQYLIYLINSPVIQDQFKKITKGTTRPRVNLTIVRGLNFPLPPINEQHRIVSKIEELFSELDNGIESLKTAREQLKIYRQALLKHAFEGKLTEQWRKDNADKLETADQLLERIKQEREDRYQHQLDAWKAAVKLWEDGGKEGKRPSKPKKLQDIAFEQDILNQLPKLFGEFLYICLGLLIDEPKYGTSKKCTYEENGTGVLRIPNVVSGRVDGSDLKYAEFDKSELDDYSIQDGDLLIIRSNGSVSIVGKAALVESKNSHYIYAGYLIRLRPNSKILCPKYLLFAIESHMLRKQIEAKAKSTSGVNNINSGEIKSLIVPVTCLEEQEEIVNVLEEKLSVVDNSLLDIDANLKKSETLRQSILKKAFSGQLVPQDPNDEPASVLLERIAKEKEAAAAKAKKATKAKTAKKRAKKGCT
ncbi:MAG: restriction endonuclease subunit S [Candidatus Electrothrix scaldis]|nr:MAG: restriction endonuclease subunit S [Candidatus Electrothrix sp. GW3-3]